MRLRKLLLAAAVAALLGFALCGMAAGYSNEGHSGDSWDDPYIIDSIGDLKRLASQLIDGQEPQGKYYRLEADLTLQREWMCPIGKYSDIIAVGKALPFSGHFDGNNKTITYDSIKYSLFDVVSSDGTAVKDLNIAGKLNYGLGGLINTLRNGTVSNCHVRTDITDRDGAGGGVVRTVRGGTVSNCSFSGRISVSYSAGGIAASVSGGSIVDCSILSGSRISGSETKSSGAGGIAGSISGGSIINCRTLPESYVRAWPGLVSTNDNGNVGGIVGRIASSNDISIMDCTSEADVQGNGYVGGIVGFSLADADEIRLTDNTWPDTEREVGNWHKGGTQAPAGSYADGHSGDSWDDPYIIDSLDDLKMMRDRINSDADPDGKYYRLDADLTISGEWTSIGQGGHGITYHFTGHFDGNNRTITLNNVTGRGLFGFVTTDGIAVKNLNVTGSIKDAKGAGGIVYELYSGTIQGCTFRGTIEGNAMGGIIDILYDGKAEDCHVLPGSKIKLTDSVSYAGGIVCLVEGDAEVENCSFGGDIGYVSGIEPDGAVGYSGGIVGSPYGRFIIRNCKTLPNSSISGGESTGGIVGYLGNLSYITDCESYAVLKGRRFVGGIIGCTYVTIYTDYVANNVYSNAAKEIGNLDGGNPPVPVPSTSPSAAPSNSPGTSPSSTPSNSPSSSPSSQPESSPSTSPSDSASTSPSGTPSDSESTPPSAAPGNSPSTPPSGQHGYFPSASPSNSPGTPGGSSPSTIPTSNINSSNPNVKPSGPAEISNEAPIDLPYGYEHKGTISIALDDDGAEYQATTLTIEVPSSFGITAGMSNLFVLIKPKGSNTYDAIPAAAVADNRITFTVSPVGKYFSKADVLVSVRNSWNFNPNPGGTGSGNTGSGSGGGSGCSSVASSALMMLAMCALAARKK